MPFISFHLPIFPRPFIVPDVMVNRINMRHRKRSAVSNGTLDQSDIVRLEAIFSAHSDGFIVIVRKAQDQQLWSIFYITRHLFCLLFLVAYALSSYREVIFIKEAFYIAALSRLRQMSLQVHGCFLTKVMCTISYLFIAKFASLAGTFRYMVFSACT